MGVLEDKKRARVFYKYLSKIYDKVNPFFWTPEMRSECLMLLDINDKDRVLDIGCGTGFGTEGLLEHTHDVHGLDQSVHQMEKAWEKLGKHDPVRFYLGDAERLPFKDETFDVVWSSGSIEYWPNPVETLREARRVTKPGGQILVVGPNEPKNVVKRRIAHAIMLFYNEEEATRMFREAGWKNIENHIIGPKRNPDVAIVTVGEKI